ncbi:low molecular weight protein-tyrosine-phosphatase [Neptuniibacter sp.]|uniref:low molecular weight protein-tyrosine-phosphatase n=1 Tax=Neptuniibacter sp. TaxID=1962643 RepID=UPI002637E09D|nr:low molecular weight protein-tyrosine-phosphatase [Neptuniibacter sp.]MCP4596838.1 low molecular weight phosphotyrosine protein phosphatase [Neptuniibacter sp.]
MKKVLFVCLGNICRSPTAHGVFQSLVDQNGLSEQIHVDSAGTAAYHVGNPPDSRSTETAKKRGYDLTPLRARQAIEEDFYEFDYILAMDSSNLINLKAIRPSDYDGHLSLFLDFTSMSEAEVPDPYYGGDAGFEHVLDLVESASQGLLEQIKKEL